MYTLTLYPAQLPLNNIHTITHMSTLTLHRAAPPKQHSHHHAYIHTHTLSNTALLYKHPLLTHYQTQIASTHTHSLLTQHTLSNKTSPYTFSHILTPHTHSPFPLYFLQGAGQSLPLIISHMDTWPLGNGRSLLQCGKGRA